MFRNKFFKRSFFDKVERNWEKAWQMNVTPWETNAVTPPLIEYFNTKKSMYKLSECRALVPGCGSGFDCLYLKQLGFGQVVGLDISETAISIAKQNSIKNSFQNNDLSFYCGDFFQFEDKQKFDFIFDYLFFTALDIPLRKDWALKMSNLLNKDENAVLMTLIFPHVENRTLNEVGPPFPSSLQDYQEQLNEFNIRLLESYKVCQQ